ncbi:ventrally expressed dharma/bozozok antagonist [Entelurus aequoreus]|uniref:ventrally expressed dharma/bozozok antagonist n=1 Tax=Entelurus aequoreus TaxID=161455 RepID=UPI002B1E3A5A|nr:ventrally expressed dharma/bozozok antagonist [Entelurus aequoreus]
MRLLVCWRRECGEDVGARRGCRLVLHDESRWSHQSLPAFEGLIGINRRGEALLTDGAGPRCRPAPMQINDDHLDVCSLGSLLMEPYYRTVKGFMVLIEKDWISFGHKFADRWDVAYKVQGDLLRNATYLHATFQKPPEDYSQHEGTLLHRVDGPKQPARRHHRGRGLRDRRRKPARVYRRPKSKSGPHLERRDDLVQQRGLEAGFSSGTEEETSGYESEGERGISPPAAPASSPPTPPSGRRPRTAFTAEQVSSLERAFKRNAYLGTQDKAELCKKLNLSDKQIRNWFQNRRMKLKRTVQDALAHACQANAASHFTHYPEMQAFRPAPYPRYHSAPPQDAALAHPHGLQYASPLPLDSLYLPGAMLSAATPPPLMGSYPAYPQYY